MTVRQLIDFLAHNSFILLVFFVALPAISWLIGIIHKRGQGGMAPWKYIYSALIYFVCIPGIFSFVITAYSLFFRNENLLDVNVLVYILPIVSMTVTLILVKKNVNFDLIPGFDRLLGLMTMIAVSFILALAIQKTRIWILFGGSIMMLIAFAAFFFALLKWGSYMLFRRKDEPKKTRPTLYEN